MKNDIQLLYDLVGQELAKGFQKSGLLARAIAESDGDEGKARALYIKYRVAELEEELRYQHEEQSKQDIDSLIRDYRAIPEILQKAIKSTPDFAYLPFNKKLSIYESSETPKAIFRIAYQTHYDRHDIDLAMEYYKAIIKKFPGSQEAEWAQQQCKNISNMTDEEKKRHKRDLETLQDKGINK